MRNRILLFAVALLLLISPSIGHAQFHLSLGPETGLNFNIHTGSDLQNSGTGFGFVIGGEVTMNFTPMIGIISRIQFYDNRSGGFSNTNTQQVQLDNGQVANIAFNVDESNSLAYLMFEELFMIKLPHSGFFFFAGPCFGFNVEGSNTTTTQITTPGISFQGGGQSQTATNSIKDVLGRFELKVGSGYDIPMSRDIAITPSVAFGFGLTKVISNVNYRILTFQALTTVKFHLL